ncbi:MAG: dihydrolipoyl dehydrogenase [Tissierellia bacterium]|nr:dihydrolipoyl dehydrogenase [Tissierellia bacterium]
MTKKVAIIGAGPGGYVAAIRLAQYNIDTTVFEYDTVGGTCLNRGCIPTKTYFKNALLMHDLKHGSDYGLNLGDVSMDGGALFDRKEKVVSTLVGGIQQLLSSYENIRFLPVKASFKDDYTLVWEEGGEAKEETFDHIIIATGSIPSVPKSLQSDLPGVLTSDDLLELKEIPKSMVVIGGGVIGLEFSSIYNALGTEITLLAPTILHGADEEISKRMIPILKKEGIKVVKEIYGESISQGEEGLKVLGRYKKKDKTEEFEGQYVLIASGRGPLVHGFGLENTTISFDERRGVEVDPTTYETAVKGVYAIGDVNSVGIQLAHVASAQGETVAALIAGKKPETHMDVWPACVFTLTEVAQVGMTEQEVKEKGLAYRTSKFPFAANGKALSLNESQGFVKLIEDEEGYLLGAHILGPHANDLITECALVIANKMKTDVLLSTIHAHPTLSETVMEAALDLRGEAIHVAKR